MTAETRARWAVAGLFLANGFAMGALSPQFPLFLDRLDIGERVMGLVILSMGLGAVGAMLLAGGLIARHGSARVGTLFALMLAPLLVLPVLAPTALTAGLALAAYGAVAGTMDVAMNAQAVTVERALGRAIMSSSHGFWSLGGFAGGASGAFLLAQAGPVSAILVAAAVVLAVVLAARRRFLPDPPHGVDDGPVGRQDEGAGTAAVRRGLPRDGVLWLLGGMALCSMVPEGAVLDWSGIYLTKEMAAPTLQAGLGFAAFAGVMAVMRFAGDHIRNRFGAVRVLRMSALTAGLGLAGAALAPDPALALAAFALAGAGVANLVPVLFSAAGNHPGLAPGRAIALVTMVGYAGILFAPATIGWIAEAAGFRQTYGGLAVLLLGVAALAGRAAAADRPGPG